MKVTAFVNHGRWMGLCPKCSNVHVLTGDTLICSACWKGLSAQKIVIDKFGAMVPAPHVEMIFETRDRAIASGEQYAVEYPADKDRIMSVLRRRPAENMNWLPGETLDELIHENLEHRLESGI